MSENYQRRRFVIKNPVEILTIFLVTVIGAFLYIHFKQIQTPFSVYHWINNAVRTQNYKHFLEGTNTTDITITTDPSKDVKHAAQKRKEVQIAGQDISVAMVKELELGNHSTFEDLEANSRSMNMGTVQEKNSIIRPTISNSKTQPVNEYVIKENQYLINHKNDNSTVDDDKVYNKDSTTVNDRLYDKMKNGSNQIIHYRQSTTDTSTPVAEEDASNSYYNVNDLSYNVDNYGYKEVKIPQESIKWTTNSQSKPIHIDDLSSSESVGGGYEHNSYSDYDVKSRYPIGHTIYYRPSVTIPETIYESKGLDQQYEKPKPRQPTYSKNNWKNIGVLLSLIYLGILKLKMIGFLQMIFLIGFKFKLFMIAIFFKFILLLKLMKFFKILILPVYIFSLLPILSSLYYRMVNTQVSNGLGVSGSSASSFFSQLPGLLEGGSSSSGIIPSLSGGASGAAVLPGLSGGSGGLNLSPGIAGGSGGLNLSPGIAGGSGGFNLLPSSTSGTLNPGISRDSSNTLLFDLSPFDKNPKEKQSRLFVYKSDE